MESNSKKSKKTFFEVWGREIDEAIMEKGIQLKEFSRRSGLKITQPTLAKIRRGETSTSVNNYVEISKYLGVDVADIASIYKEERMVGNA